MGKRFIKFRVSRVIPSFHSCRSKDPSSLPSLPQPTKPPSIKRHVSTTLLSFLRPSSSRSSPRPFPETSHTQSHHFRWRKSPKWHVIAKVPVTDYNNYHPTPPRPKIYTSNDVVLFPPLPLKKSHRPPPRRKSIGSRKRRSFQKLPRASTSSSDSGITETDTLLSSDDSTAVRLRGRRRRKAEEEAAPARLSEFMRRKEAATPWEVVEGKVRESFAVVKRSEDPYEDFKKSMAEMVVEKEMYEVAELEEMLRCFLSLNSAHHHSAIVRAFSEVWEALFSISRSSSSS